MPWVLKWTKHCSFLSLLDVVFAVSRSPPQCTRTLLKVTVKIDFPTTELKLVLTPLIATLLVDMFVSVGLRLSSKSSYPYITTSEGECLVRHVIVCAHLKMPLLQNIHKTVRTVLYYYYLILLGQNYRLWSLGCLDDSPLLSWYAVSWHMHTHILRLRLIANIITFDRIYLYNSIFVYIEMEVVIQFVPSMLLEYVLHHVCCQRSPWLPCPPFSHCILCPCCCCHGDFILRACLLLGELCPLFLFSWLELPSRAAILI